MKRLSLILTGAVVALLLTTSSKQAFKAIANEDGVPADPGVSRVPLSFSYGHATDPRDRGRPVILVASALRVPPEVFREAFSRVHPAPGGSRPTREQEHANKRVLLNALGPDGVTNERLDEVSDYYRYRPQNGELWPTAEATGYALLKHGKLIGLQLTSGGSGYSSSPVVSARGLDLSGVQVQLAYGPDFESNGSVAKLILPGSQ